MPTGTSIIGGHEEPCPLTSLRLLAIRKYIYQPHAEVMVDVIDISPIYINTPSDPIQAQGSVKGNTTSNKGVKNCISNKREHLDKTIRNLRWKGGRTNIAPPVRRKLPDTCGRPYEFLLRQFACLPDFIRCDGRSILTTLLKDKDIFIKSANGNVRGIRERSIKVNRPARGMSRPQLRVKEASIYKSTHTLFLSKQ